MTFSRFTALALAGITLTACISTEPVPRQDYGFVVLVGQPNGEGGSEIADPIAYFLRTSQLGLSENGATSDQCETGQLPGSSGPVPGLPYIDAGATVTVGTGGAPIVLERDLSEPGLILYAQEGLFAYTPGGAISASVPGADGGFPEMTVTGTSAPAFTFDEVPVSDQNVADIALSWEPPPTALAGKTTMNVSLRYADDATQLNRQIFCTLVDDGAATVTGILSEGWHNSQNDLRDALFERVKIDFEEDEESRSTLVLFSTYLQSEPAPAP